MSTSGPPGGPIPAGEPQDPWPGDKRFAQYPNPSDPFGIAAAWGTPRQDDQESAAPYGQPPTAPYNQQPAPPNGQPADHPRQPDYLRQPPFPAPPAPYAQPPVHPQPVASEEPTQHLLSQQQPEPGPYPQSPDSQPSGPTAEDTWASPAASQQPAARRSRLVFATVTGVVVVLGGAIATGVYLASHQNTAADTFNSAPAVQPVPASASPQAQSSPGASASDGTEVGNDAVVAQPGDCLVNDGTNDAPKLRKVTCAKGTYEVLKRFPGTTDKKKCDGVPGYTHNYFFDSSVDSEDFVLCLRQRK